MDLYLATQRYLREAGFEIVCKTEDLHAENAPDNIESEHEVMFTAEGIRTKAIIARLPRRAARNKTARRSLRGRCGCGAPRILTNPPFIV